MIKSLPLLALLGALLAGCDAPGKVEQGRVVAFDAEKRIVTLIRDTRADADHPDYSQLPPQQFRLPDDPKDTGPLPRAGLRLRLDSIGQRIVYFDPASQSFREIAYTPVAHIEGVAPNDVRLKGRQFPEFDAERQQLTLYSARQKLLETLRLPESARELPATTWAAGDEVRIYYKEAGQALRFMNITQTDIFKK